MEPRYATIDEPATAEYVLDVLRDMHRQTSQFDDCVDPEVELSFETTVEEWREADDLLPWRAMGRAYNRLWGIHCSDAEWRQVLVPGCQKRLSDVCHLIAQHTTKPRIRPARFLGSDCLSGGAFLTIRSLLHEAGADARKIGPSTLLAPFTRRFGQVFLERMSRLAPGALPPVRIRTPFYDAVTRIAFCCMLAFVLSLRVSLPLVTLVAGFLLLVMYVGAFISSCLPPADVEFGNLQTFRDLARVVAKHHQRQ